MPEKKKDIIQSLIDKAQGLLEDAPPPNEKQVVKITSFDKWDLDDVRAATGMLDNLDEALIHGLDGGREMTQDVQAAFFKVEPELAGIDEMVESHRPNSPTIAQMLQLPEVQSLREMSVGDPVNAAIAANSMQQPILSTAERVIEVIHEQEVAMDEARKAHHEAADALDRLADTAATTTSPAEQFICVQALQAAMDQFARTKVQFDEQSEELQKKLEQAAKAGAQQMRKVANAIANEIAQNEELAAMFGTDPGQMQKMAAKDRIELARRLKGNRLKEFMKLIGKFKAVQKAESRKRVPNMPSEIHSVMMGDNLERLTTGEFFNFASEELETLFWLRWTEDQLLVYDVRGREKMGQGPVVCVVDESGSMGARDVLGGTREAWSKALSLAMLDQARTRKRDFYYIGFASAGQVRTVFFPRGEAQMDLVLEMTEGFLGGGTYYEGPLNDALDFIEEHYESDPRNQGKPDIIFISDDEYTDSFPKDWMKRYKNLKERIGIKVYAIAVGCSAGGAMKAIADDVREVTEVVSDPSRFADMFRMV